MAISELVAELYADYPLVYITGPDERDIALTVSQITDSGALLQANWGGVAYLPDTEINALK